MTETLSVRIPEEDVLEIGKMAKLEKKNKSNVLREILEMGIKEKRLKIALKKFMNKEVTVAKAAELACVPLTNFMDILSERKISFHYTIKEVEEEFEDLL